jgi:hypothetical protein
MMIPPQDCLLIRRDVVGKVTDLDSKPIPNATVQVRAGFESGFAAGRIDLRLTSDDEGAFQRDGVSDFACDNVLLTISAPGFQETSRSYLAEPGLLQSLPGEIAIALRRAP